MEYEILQRRFDALHQSDEEAVEAEARRLASKGDTVVISACLVGIRSRYDGGSKPLEHLPDDFATRVLVPICPEVLAGFTVPRPACWFVGGDGVAVLDGRAQLVNEMGRDVTTSFVHGCRRALRIALLARGERALLKDRSPSCGVHEIWCDAEMGKVKKLVESGNIEGSETSNLTVRKAGLGVFAALLTRQGIPLETESWSQEISMT